MRVLAPVVGVVGESVCGPASRVTGISPLAGALDMWGFRGRGKTLHGRGFDEGRTPG